MSCAATPIPIATRRGACRARSCCCSTFRASARSRRSCRAARDEAIEANRSKSRFLAAASHDLRQPLHAMTLFVSALKRRLPDGEAGELIGNVDQSLRSLRSMFDTLLDMSKIEAGLIKPNPAPLALGEFFASLEPGFAATARERNVEFRVVPTSAHAIADRTLLELALRNLLANAFKFTRAGGVLLGCRRGHGEIGIVVADTGRRHRARARRAGVRGIPSRQDGGERSQRRHRPRACDRQAPDGADGRAGDAALSARQGQRVHALAARGGRGGATASARLAARRHVAGPKGPDPRRRSALRRRDEARVSGPRRPRRRRLDRSPPRAPRSTIRACPRRSSSTTISATGATGLQFVELLRAKGADPSVVFVSGSTTPEVIAALRGSGVPWLTKPVDPRALRSTLIHALAR